MIATSVPRGTRKAVVLFAVACFSKTAIAEDPSASFVTRLFMDVCIPNVGRPENVRAWALEKKLAEIPDSRRGRTSRSRRKYCQGQ